MDRHFLPGDRVISKEPHARGTIVAGNYGTVYHVHPRIHDDLVFVSWDGHSGELRDYEEYGISDMSGWSVYGREITLVEFSDEEIPDFDVESLFQSV